MKESDLVFGIMATFARQEYSVAQIRDLAAPFGIAESSVRTALSRMRAKGQVTAVRRGRSAFYGFGKKGRAVVGAVSRGFRTLDWSSWDGGFWGALFSVPERRRPHRHEVTKRLRGLHFAPYHPGFWIRPLHRGEGIQERLAGSTASDWYSLIMFEPLVPFDASKADALWGLAALDGEMSLVLQQIRRSRGRMVGLAPGAAFVEKMKLGAAAVATLARDPRLPAPLVPPGFCGETLRREVTLWNDEITERSRPFWQPVLESQPR